VKQTDGPSLDDVTTSCTIQLARFLDRSVSGANGPGERAVVWVQGCPRRPICPGCFNPLFLEFGDHPHVRRVSPDQLVQMVLQEHARRPLEGVTFSGGEPMAQADPLALVAKKLRALGMNVVVFTGYTWDDLCQSETPARQRLLAETDLMIAGPFVQDQEAIYLTDRVQHAEGAGGQVELQVEDDGGVHMTGFPSPALRARLGALLDPMT
jgi:anaerobic ribonucleoside-triphosphate reductase activating protein